MAVSIPERLVGATPRRDENGSDRRGCAFVTVARAGRRPHALEAGRRTPSRECRPASTRRGDRRTDGNQGGRRAGCMRRRGFRARFQPVLLVVATAAFLGALPPFDPAARAQELPTASIAAERAESGICDRTPAVRDQLMVLLRLALTPGYQGDCAGVTGAWLARLTSVQLVAPANRVTTLRRGDFAGLARVRTSTSPEKRSSRRCRRGCSRV